jgi:aquaporin Z
MFSGWTDRRAVAPIVAELAGTFLFFFVGIGAAVGLGSAVDPAAGLVVVALAHGIVLAVLVSALGAISGGHFNPAVTFGVWLAGRIAWRRAAAYGIAQLIGALLAALAVRYVFSAVAPASTLGIPALGPGFDATAGIVVETVLTVILLIAVFGTAIDPRAPKIGGIAIGFAVGADILMGGPLTGAAMNPARWFGPAAVTGMWNDWFVWVAGPLLGAAIVALAYRYLFAEEASLARTPAEPMA